MPDLSSNNTEDIQNFMTLDGDGPKEAPVVKDPYAGINFVERHVVINGKDGNPVFDEHVFFPDYFDENSVKIVSSKYLANSSKRKERDLREMVDRVSNTITELGKKDGYFSTQSEADDFNYKLKYYQIHQYFAFNSPVYFNVGIFDKFQASACFILDVEDEMTSITDWISTESQIFKKGSGSGINLSKLRSSREKVNGSGTASGPISFLKASDVFAGVIRSGGTFRRAAKMARLDIDHPDIMTFLTCKDKEEIKLKLIKDGGITPDTGYELSDEVFFQNTNISVGIPDIFMETVKSGGKWYTREVLTGNIVDEYDAKDLLMEISRHAWNTGDPGIQFHDTINKFNTTPAEGKIRASNPCGEFLAQSYQSCNLAALNLLKFFKVVNGVIVFDYDMYEDVIRTVITAQDIFIDNATYPTEKIKEQTHKFRSLGMGYTNLGALCMYLGFPYDSNESRSLTSIITSLMTSIAHQTSVELARKVGPGEWWNNDNNKVSVYDIIRSMLSDTKNITPYNDVFKSIKAKAVEKWQVICDLNRPLRNAQLTLIAPTGTTSFLMGAIGFGCEPFFGLITYKTLSGNDGAVIKSVNTVINDTLINLRYSQVDVNNIIDELVIDEIAIENSKYILSEHIPIFDTAIPPANGTRAISYHGHIDMMGAIQPFINGAISKTIGMSKDCTVQDVYDLYFECWEKGLKSLTIYRDGSKTEQVLVNYDKTKEVVVAADAYAEHLQLSKPYRKRMPIDGEARRHKFSINGEQTQGYILTGLYENGNLGEIFIEGTNFGSTLGGFTDSLAIITSIALQYGVPLETLVAKLMHTKFEPSGFSANPEIRTCTSLVSYIFRYLGLKYLPDDKLNDLGLKRSDITTIKDDHLIETISTSICPSCGALLRKLGSCDFCSNCAWNSGACS